MTVRRSRRRRSEICARAGLLALALLSAAAGAGASDAPLSGADGHPRERFPLVVHARVEGLTGYEVTFGTVLRDWNAVARAGLGVDAFVTTEREEEAGVRVTILERPLAGAADSGRLMGYTEIDARDGVVVVPVRIVIAPPVGRGRTSAERVLYQVLAHELGHALGLSHVTDPRSLMCCVRGAVDLNDPATRAAYVEARRNPDLASVGAQLTEHYRRVWRTRTP